MFNKGILKFDREIIYIAHKMPFLWSALLFSISWCLICYIISTSVSFKCFIKGFTLELKNIYVYSSIHSLSYIAELFSTSAKFFAVCALMYKLLRQVHPLLSNLYRQIPTLSIHNTQCIFWVNFLLLVRTFVKKSQYLNLVPTKVRIASCYHIRVQLHTSLLL